MDSPSGPAGDVGSAHRLACEHQRQEREQRQGGHEGDGQRAEVPHEQWEILRVGEQTQSRPA